MSDIHQLEDLFGARLALSEVKYSFVLDDSEVETKWDNMEEENMQLRQSFE